MTAPITTTSACPYCNGTGEVEPPLRPDDIYYMGNLGAVACLPCAGTGKLTDDECAALEEAS